MAGGAQITASGHVTGLLPAGAAAAAGVPVPSRIVGVDGVAVRSKAQVGAALSTAGSAVAFVFLTRDLPAAERGAAEAVAAAAAEPAADPWQVRASARRGSCSRPSHHLAS